MNSKNRLKRWAQWQRLIKAGFTELGLEDLSREDLMNTLAEQMSKEQLSVSEEEEEGAVGGD